MAEVGFHVRLPEEIRQEMELLAKEHERTLNGEVNFALKTYVEQQKRASYQVERIITFWLAEMWRREDLGRVTPENLYKVIQKLSAYPDKELVTIQDCAREMKRHAQETLPHDWSVEDQKRGEESLRQSQKMIAELSAIDDE